MKNHNVIKRLFCLVIISLLGFTGCEKKSGEIINKKDIEVKAQNKSDNFNEKMDKKINNLDNKNTLEKNNEKFKEVNKNIKGKETFVKKEYLYSKNGKQIKLKYPQISNANNIKEHNQLNKLILDAALKPLKDYTDNNKNYTITLDYTITLNTNNILSIKYNGIFYSKGLSYPTNLCYATNIDLINVKILALKDIVKVDNVFLQSLKTKGTIIINKKASSELLQAQKDILKNYSIKELEDLTLDGYLTSTSVVVIVPLPHAIGDYMNVEVQFRNIEENIILHDKKI